MGKLIDVDKFLNKVKKDREHEIYLHSWTADMVLERLDSWYAPTVEAIPKADYEARLKADLKAILVELQLEIEELDLKDSVPDYQKGADETREYIADLLQQKIDGKDSIVYSSKFVELLELIPTMLTKDDVVAMLEDLKQDIIAESWHIECYDVNANDLVVQISDVDKVIQQKIDAFDN